MLKRIQKKRRTFLTAIKFSAVQVSSIKDRKTIDSVVQWTKLVCIRLLNQIYIFKLGTSQNKPKEFRDGIFNGQMKLIV
jgi:hypothetical protein